MVAKQLISSFRIVYEWLFSDTLKATKLTAIYFQPFVLYSLYANHTLVSTLTRFGIYRFHLEGGQPNCNFFSIQRNYS
jgi:hypothetical protein